MKTGIYLDAHALAAASFAHGRDRGAAKAQRVDIAALTSQIGAGRDVVVRRAYVAVRPSQDSSKFISLLTRFGYDVSIEKAPPAQVLSDSNIDPAAKLSLDAYADTDDGNSGLDCVVIVSGRRSMIPIAQRLRQDGVHVEVWFFSEAMSPDLLTAVDEYHEIEGDMLYGAEMIDDRQVSGRRA